MSDHGHDLVFGSFTTPGSTDPATTVGLALSAERAGLDLVTFQDHPYQPGFLDTWTLLSFVAARTTTVRLAANVTNLPLRPPAVLARSVASLDLLSGGRVELGLGAGGFWEAIESMGGRRLTAGQSVQALEEAIEIIRELWDVQKPGSARVDGEFHRVRGTKRGPAPAHEVPIWVGAYRPRMLRLVGRRADGWLPSMAYLKPGDLAAGNAVIDEAARSAGRQPADVRRLLNVVGRFSAVGRGPLDGPPEQWVEELADLALTEGISTFILASDDPDDLNRFGAEVAPGVREMVDEERARLRGAPGDDRVPSPGGPTAGATYTSRALRQTVATPDDGVRRSTQKVWDEATRPSSLGSSKASTDAPSGRSGGRHLVEVHDVLRRELTQLLELVDQVANGTADVKNARSRINQMTMRQNTWTVGAYCEAYCLTVTQHHGIEDRALFPALRRDLPELTSVIDRLEVEHGILHGVLDAVDRALVASITAPQGMAELREATDLLSDALLSHLAYEERELIDPIDRIGLLT